MLYIGTSEDVTSHFTLVFDALRFINIFSLDVAIMVVLSISHLAQVSELTASIVGSMWAVKSLTPRSPTLFHSRCNTKRFHLYGDGSCHRMLESVSNFSMTVICDI